jgi:hypothetical protein
MEGFLIKTKCEVLGNPRTSGASSPTYSLALLLRGRPKGALPPSLSPLGSCHRGQRGGSDEVTK